MTNLPQTPAEVRALAVDAASRILQGHDFKTHNPTVVSRETILLADDIARYIETGIKP